MRLFASGRDYGSVGIIRAIDDATLHIERRDGAIVPVDTCEHAGVQHFGTSAPGIAIYAASLADLAISAFAATLGSATAATRLRYALARDARYTPRDWLASMRRAARRPSHSVP